MVRILLTLIVASLTHHASAGEIQAGGETKGKPPTGASPLRINPTPDQTCALKKILEAAQKVSKEQFGDRDRGTNSPLAIRKALEKLGVNLGETGNAMDYVRILPKDEKFKATGITVEGDIPEGSIVVYSGPHSEEYLKTGVVGGRPGGDWYGDMAIKGEEGNYYADGKKKDPSLRRTIAGVFIPNHQLAKEICNHTEAVKK